MKVTVGISTWNRSAELRQTLEYMLQLRIPAGVDWELLVVDNNSTDDTQQAIAAFQGQLPVRALFEPRQGKCVACNRLIAEAQGEYILWTDDDVGPHPDWIASTCDAFQKFAADVVFGPIAPWWIDERPRWYGDCFQGKFALLNYGEQPFIVSDTIYGFFGANFAARREALERVGGFREDLGPVKEAGTDEDSDLFRRFLGAGMKIVYEPRASVLHRIDPVRCKKAYHRQRAWRSRATYLRHVQSGWSNNPSVAGIPRFLYRLAVGDAWSYLKASATGNHSAQFYHELRLIQFAGLLRHALHRRWQSAPSHAH